MNGVRTKYTLTSDETAQLRHKVVYGQRRSAKLKYVPVQLSGGPLGGLTVQIDSSIVDGQIGWCVMRESGELIQVLYKYVVDGGWVFDEVASVAGGTRPIHKWVDLA